MKKKILYPLILILFFAACKYEDGPIISLSSPKNRLLQEWKIENVKVDGIDSTQRYSDSCNCDLEFISNNDYIGVDVVLLHNCKNLPAYYDPNDIGYWTFKDHKKILHVGFSGNSYEGLGPIGLGKISDWEILKLTGKKFWFKTTFNNKVYEFKLKII